MLHLLLSLAIAADEGCSKTLATGGLKGVSHRELEHIEVTHDSAGVSVAIPNGGFKATVREVSKDVYAAEIEVVHGEGEGGHKGRAFGGGGEGEGFHGRSSGPIAQRPASDPRTLKQCVSRSVVLFGASSVANLVGAYSAFYPVNLDPHLPWYAASFRWVVEKTRNGIATPAQYARAFRDNTDFRYNNVWNAVLMGTLSTVECALGKAKANAVVGAVALLSSAAGQWLAKGEIGLAQTALDIVFVRLASLPRVRVGAYFDQTVFQRHSPGRRLVEVSAYYLVDQYLGGFGYGIFQNVVVNGWPQRLNVKIGASDLDGFTHVKFLRPPAHLGARLFPNG